MNGKKAISNTSAARLMAPWFDFEGRRDKKQAGNCQLHDRNIANGTTYRGIIVLGEYHWPPKVGSEVVRHF